MSNTETAVSLEDVEAKLRQRRDALPARTEPRATGAHGSTNEPSTWTTCPVCEYRREIPIVVIGGRPLYTPPVSICDPCREKLERGTAELAARAKTERRAREESARRDSILDVLKSTGVNVWDHQHATLDNYDAGDSGAGPIDAAREFLAEVRRAEKYDQIRGLYLFGNTGCGKSHLAVAVARELLLDPTIRPDEVVYDHALRLIGKIQRTYSNEQSADEVLNRRINAKLWILDDLGTEAPSPDVVRRLTEIFTERAMRPTLVTSNLAPDGLEKRHAEFFRVVSRLGPRYFRTVMVRGKDRRFSTEAA